MSTTAGDDIGQSLVRLVLFVFRLTFPLVFLTACALSWALADDFQLYQFAGLAMLTMLAFRFASANPWGLALIGIFVVASIPLAWIAWREHATKMSAVITAWVVAAIEVGFTVWLSSYWPWSGLNFQLVVYGFLLLASWDAIYNALLSSLKLRAQARANRPIPAPTAQQPHGGRNSSRQSPRGRDEPETI